MVKKQVNSKLIVSSTESTSLPAAKKQKLSSGESNNVQTTDITASSSLIEKENIIINENQFDNESETNNNNKNQIDQPQAQAQQSQLKEEQSNSPLKQFTAAAASNNVITEQVTETNTTTIPTPTTQTVKLTNCDQITEETASHQSNSFYYLSGNFN